MEIVWVDVKCETLWGTLYYYPHITPTHMKIGRIHINNKTTTNIITYRVVSISNYIRK
jgi:hypothetical protein